jgi:hypothetical protein
VQKRPFITREENTAIVTTREGGKMTSQSIEASVLALVKDQWHGGNARSIRIASRFPEFVRGYLYIVEIIDADGDEHENFVYLVDKSLKYFGDADQLALGVGKITTAGDLVRNMIQFGGIAGIIAIVITSTICYRMIAQGNFDVPNPVGTWVTIILGFYFGTSVHKLTSTKGKE